MKLDHCEGALVLTVLLVLGQTHEVLQDVDDGGELLRHLEGTAQRGPELHVHLQSHLLDQQNQGYG